MGREREIAKSEPKRPLYRKQAHQLTPIAEPTKKDDRFYLTKSTINDRSAPPPTSCSAGS